MHRPRKPRVPTRLKLHHAALRLVASGKEAASVRAITRAAGVTEGALYRHYKSRSMLLAAVYAELVQPMIAEKEQLVAMRAPIADRVREWVRCTYAQFDHDPSAFAYVFLTDHKLPKEHERISGRQSELLAQLMAQGQREGVLRTIEMSIAKAIFVGLLLCVPMRIRQSVLKGPALAHTDEIFGAVWGALATQPRS